MRLSPGTSAASACFVGALALVGCAAETRKPSDSYAPISVTRGEVFRIDAALQEAHTLAEDYHRRCALWRRVAREATTEQPGLREYASERTKQSCDEERERRHDAAEAAVTAAEGAPSLPASRAAFTALDRFYERSIPGRDRTLDDLVARARALLGRLPENDVTCDDRKAVAWLEWKSSRAPAAKDRMMASSIRPCMGVRETRAILQAALDSKAKSECGSAVALTSEVWPRTSSPEEQVALIDGVVGCSDAYTLRRNLAFVPRDVLTDYQSLRRAREAQFRLDEAHRQAAEAVSDARERCSSSCMTMYADQGGVCTDSCRGDTICFKNCQRLGAECFRQCR